MSQNLQNYPGLEVSDREKIEIFVSCRSIQSSSNYHVQMQKQNNQTKQWQEIFKTETSLEHVNPNFSKSCIIDYIFEVQQHIKFILYGNTPSNPNCYIGECQTTISQIVGAKNQTCIFDIKNINSPDKSIGKIILRAEKVALCNDDVILKISGKKIKDLRFFTKSCPFLVFYRTSENKGSIKVYQTEFSKNNLNPRYNEIKVKAQKICNGDYNMPILVECWDYYQNGQHKYIGQATFTINEMVNQNGKELKLFNKNKGNSFHAGSLVFDNVELIERPQFLDYIRGGTHLNLVCAVDFTGSNGVPTQRDSLHAILSYELNNYQQAIKCVGDILLNYDEDKMVPFYGFGAKPKLPHYNFTQTLHCFPLNGQPNAPEVKELKGMMDTYKQFLNHVDLSGPTLFNPLIQETMKIAQQSKQQNDNNYYILLILTDGEIHDMEQTTASIVDSSHLPMSIIIVGIGNADFKNMDILDGDDGLVDYNGRTAQRDLVQFVPFNKYKNNPEELAQNVLEELPDQLVEYYRLIGQKPSIPSYQRMQSIQVQNYPPLPSDSNNNNVYQAQPNNNNNISNNQQQNNNNYYNKQQSNEDMQDHITQLSQSQNYKFLQCKNPQQQQIVYPNYVAPPPPPQY